MSNLPFYLMAGYGLKLTNYFRKTSQSFTKYLEFLPPINTKDG